MVKDQCKLNLSHTEGKQQKEIIYIYIYSIEQCIHGYSKVDKEKDQDGI